MRINRRVARRERAQLDRVRRLLPGPVTPPVLPHVVQHRNAALGRELADRVEQPVGRPPARGELDADHPRGEPAADLGAGVGGVVRVHGDVAADAVGVLALERQERRVTVLDVGGRREIDRRGAAPAPEDRGHVDRDPDPVPCREPAGVPLAPIGPRGQVVVEMGVHVDEHGWNLSRCGILCHHPTIRTAMRTPPTPPRPPGGPPPPPPRGPGGPTPPRGPGGPTPPRGPGGPTPPRGPGPTPPRGPGGPTVPRGPGGPTAPRPPGGSPPPRGPAPPKAGPPPRPAARPAAAKPRRPRNLPGWLARAQRLLFQPAQEWATIAGEFTTAGPIYGRYVLPMAAIGPVAATVGTVVFGVRSSLGGTYAMSAGDAVTGGVLEYGLSFAGVYLFALLINLLAPMLGGQRNQVQALKIAAYGATPYWLGGVVALFPRLSLIGAVFGLYSVRLLAAGLAPVMKTPRDKTGVYTLLATIGGIIVALLISAVSQIFMSR